LVRELRKTGERFDHLERIHSRRGAGFESQYMTFSCSGEPDRTRFDPGRDPIHLTVLMKIRPRVCDLPSALARLGSNVKLARDMLALFREEAPVYQSQLNIALASGDSAGVHRASHSLRGMLCMFGAEAAMQVAQRLEQMGSDGDLTEAPAQAKMLDSEIIRFLKTASTRIAKL
jgi:HPt (histidine-containing phosphotransfer) domain-containing protein